MHLREILKIKRIYVHIYALFVIFITYLVLVSMLNPNLIHPTPDAYYNLQLDAFMHGRLNLISSYTYDLSPFHGKWYMYWGPAPVLFILPFYILFGIGASSILYTFLAGLANVILFYLVLRAFTAYFKLHLSIFSELFLLFSFSFCSANFALSFVGRLSNTPTEQVIATCYLLIFYLFYFKWLANLKNLFYLTFAVIFFNLAWLSRYTMIFHGVLFLYPFFITKISQWKQLLKPGIIVISIVAVFITGDLIYNYARFSNPFETGHQYHQGNKRYAQILKTHRIFSTEYIPQNVYYYFFHLPKFFLYKPFMEIDREGNSIFAIYPGILFLILFLRKKYIADSQKKLFILLASSIIAVTIMVFMLYFATGWVQFGSRFFLDITPLTYLLIAFVIEDVLIIIRLLTIMYALFINFVGTIELVSK